jgi:Uma2 family endonuclease
VKYRLYARAGIAEYWIIDLSKQRTLVCRRPNGDEYDSVNSIQANEEVSPMAEPSFVLSLASFLV